MPTQVVPLAHPWDAGQQELHNSHNLRLTWHRPGEHPDVYGGGYQGLHAWWCFRGLAVPRGATLTRAALTGLQLVGGGRFRAHHPGDGAVDADPPGSAEALSLVLEELVSGVAEMPGLTTAQADAVALFWGDLTGNGQHDPATIEGMAAIMASVEWVYEWCIVQGNWTQGYDAMVGAFGDWDTIWPYNWAGWTPAGGWDFDPPDLTASMPDLASLLQPLVDAATWRPGNAVLLLASPPAGADEEEELRLERGGGENAPPPPPVALELEWTQEGGV